VAEIVAPARGWIPACRQAGSAERFCRGETAGGNPSLVGNNISQPAPPASAGLARPGRLIPACRTGWRPWRKLIN